MAHTGEKAIAGRTTGLIELGEEVTWRGRHLGFIHEHTARITAFARPQHFRDEMTRGRFARFVHDHYFEPIGSGTRIRDVIEFESPCGWIGSLFDALVLKKYLTRLIEQRLQIIRAEAEGATAPE